MPKLPACVLSGGRYDSLLQRMHKPGGAIGFAVNVGLLDALGTPPEAYDADVLLLYGTDPVSYTHLDVYKRQSWGLWCNPLP